MLDTYAGCSSLAIVVFGILSRVITLFLRITGQLERSIDQAGGRLPAGSG